jgi:hypothetical protein
VLVPAHVLVPLLVGVLVFVIVDVLVFVFAQAGDARYD